MSGRTWLPAPQPGRASLLTRDLCHLRDVTQEVREQWLLTSFERVWAPCARPWPCQLMGGFGTHSSSRTLCRGRLQKVPAPFCCHSPRVVVAEPMCGSQEEVRTYSPAHTMSDLVLGK